MMELNALDFIKTLGVSFAALFPIVNPLGDAPIFFRLTQNYPQSAQKVLARKIAAYGFVLLIARDAKIHDKASWIPWYEKWRLFRNFIRWD